MEFLKEEGDNDPQEILDGFFDEFNIPHEISIEMLEASIPSLDDFEAFLSE